MTRDDVPDDRARGSSGDHALPDANPADVQEQQRPVGSVSPPPSRGQAYDVPEADALDQSLEVPLDDDADRP